jgi:outer membrane protein OmpA-like peptidoglycan-associated protein
MLLFAVGLAGILFLGLDAKPTSTVVLLPDADGRAGAVDLHTDSASLSLDTPYASATSNARGSFTRQTESAQVVQQRYASTLAARPGTPISFVLVFEFGSAQDVSPAFQPVLQQLLAQAANYPAPEITVIGHTDRVGSVQDNDRLSLQRAQTVRDLLVRAGVDPATITLAGRGEREPAVATADEEPLAENRRVEINLR